MTHRDRAGDPSGHRAGHRAGRREAAGDAGHRQGFPTPPPNRPLPVRPPDRNGGFPRLSDGPMLLDGAHGLRCPAPPGRLVVQTDSPLRRVYPVPEAARLCYHGANPGDR